MENCGGLLEDCVRQADSRIQRQSAKNQAAIFRKSSPPTTVTDAAIVPRGNNLSGQTSHAKDGQS
jgi:hypothetical protein